MKAQHTPGPWEVYSHSWSDTSIYAKQDNSYCVCRLSIYDEATEANQSELESEMDANAQLIAAAPDLLAVVKDYIANGHSKALQERAKVIVDKATKG